jgi:hypothetical protein
MAIYELRMSWIARGFSYKSSKTMDSDKKDSIASQDEGIETIK